MGELFRKCCKKTLDIFLNKLLERAKYKKTDDYYFLISLEELTKIRKEAINEYLFKISEEDLISPGDRFLMGVGAYTLIGLGLIIVVSVMHLLYEKEITEQILIFIAIAILILILIFAGLFLLGKSLIKLLRKLIKKIRRK